MLPPVTLPVISGSAPSLGACCCCRMLLSRQHELLPWLRPSRLLRSGLPWSAVCSISWRCVVVGHVPSCANVMLRVINPAALSCSKFMLTLIGSSSHQ